jgi:hypothetical protein
LLPRGKVDFRKLVEFFLGITVVSGQLLFIGAYTLLKKMKYPAWLSIKTDASRFQQGSLLLTASVLVGQTQVLFFTLC